jgi:magnesium chelatase family protein
MRYTARLSGPLLDRIDLRVTVGRVRARDVLAADRAELDSARALRRVVAARRRAVDRLAPHGLDVNGRVPGAVLRGALRLGPATTATLDRALDHGLLSLRGYDRVLRAAWTLADLDEVDRPHAEHLARALRWRGVEAIA